MQSPWISQQTAASLHGKRTNPEGYVLGIYCADPKEIATSLSRPCRPAPSKAFRLSSHTFPSAKFHKEQAQPTYDSPESPVVLERPQHGRYLSPTVSLF